MTVKEITRLIEDFAPLSLQASYDNSGLFCGSPDTEVKSVLLCIDITEEVIDEAIGGGHNLIISHHPLTMQGVRNLVPGSYIQRCIIKAIKNDIHIYAAHTNIDSVKQGVSGRMADSLHLTRQQILQPEGKLYSLTFFTPETAVEKVRNAVLDTGTGHTGAYSRCSFNSTGNGLFQASANATPYCGEPGKLHTEKEVRTEITVPGYLLENSICTLLAAHPYEEPVYNAVCIDNINPMTGFGILGELQHPMDSRLFLQQVKETFQCTAVRHTRILKPEIRKVAVCGGSGASMIRRAIARNADILITGDIKYHDFFLAENHLIIADIGHYESEQYTKDIFYELVTKKISKFAVQFSQVNTNPINYL